MSPYQAAVDMQRVDMPCNTETQNPRIIAICAGARLNANRLGAEMPSF
jgi:hypothetical protein